MCHSVCARKLYRKEYEQFYLCAPELRKNSAAPPDSACDAAGQKTSLSKKEPFDSIKRPLCRGTGGAFEQTGRKGMYAQNRSVKRA